MKRSLVTLPRRWVGSEGREIIAHATQKGRRVTTNLWQYQQNFSEACHTKKEVESQATRVQVTRTCRRHRTYSTCHTKRTWGHKVLLGGRVTSAPATQNRNRVTRNFPEASKILHLPHKKKVGSPLSPMICTCHTKRRLGPQATLASRSRKKCSEASKNIAPATQSERIGSRRTARRQGRNLPQNGTSVTGNFSQCHGDLLGGV